MSVKVFVGTTGDVRIEAHTNDGKCSTITDQLLAAFGSAAKNATIKDINSEFIKEEVVQNSVGQQ